MQLGGHALVADDHPLVREGLSLAIRAAAPGIAIDSVGSIEDAERSIGLRKGGYRIVLLDFVLPDARGFSGFLRLQHVIGRTPIVLISAREDPMVVEAARALGAAGFLSKMSALDTLASALRTILDGQAVFPEAHTTNGAAKSARDRIATLSGAQLRVLLALADGRLNKQIADSLSITEATVKAHLTAIFRKLDVDNRAQALLAVQPLLADMGRP